MPDEKRAIEESKSRVLVVDDTADMHQLLRVRLRHEDLELDSAFSESEAVAKATQWQPELVLLDLALPGEEGLSVLRKLKEDPRTRSIPVIIVSGHQASRYKVAAFELGAVDYITKPFELVELRVRIRSALRMHQLLQMLAQKAQIDGLTGLWNRAFFDKRWGEECSRAHRHGHSLALALLDLDHFKSVNDNYGHPVGDMVLQSVGKILQRLGRESDLACRYGGEEFVLIMPDTNAIEAAVLCERLRQAVAELRWARVADLRITCSLGVVGSTGPGRLSAEQWVEATDQNLYHAKRTGRNRLVVTDLAGTTTMNARAA